jgi:hypothetical protein
MSCWNLGREVVQLEGLPCIEWGTVTWVVKVDGNESLSIGIVVGINKV